jgi:hypothetical protein
MFTTPEIICDVFSFLDKDQIERIQLINKLWNNIIIRHKNILPLRQFEGLEFVYTQKIYLYATKEEISENLASYIIEFDGSNLIEKNVSSRYSQLTVDEILNNLNDVVFNSILVQHNDSEDHLDNILNSMKLVTTKTGGRFRGRDGLYNNGRFGSKLNEMFGKAFIITVRYKIQLNPIS